MRLVKKGMGRLFAVATEATVLQSSIFEYFCCSRPETFFPDFGLSSCSLSSSGEGITEWSAVVIAATGGGASSVLGEATSVVETGTPFGGKMPAEGYSGAAA